MKNKIVYILKLYVFACISFMLFSCESSNSDIDVEDKTPPKDLLNLKVKESLHGALIFEFDLPDDPDIFYIDLTYKFNDEVFKKSVSYFNDTIMVFGIPDTNEYIYNFKVVDRSGNKSKGIDLKSSCKKPPHYLADESSSIRADYGGAILRWENESEEWVYLNVLFYDEDEVEVMQQYKSKLKSDSITIGNTLKGDRTFSYYFSDAYKNVAETQKATLSILPANPIPKDNSKLIYLKGDIPAWQIGPDIFNGNIRDRTIPYNNTIDLYVPNYFTVSIGLECQVTKIVLNNVPEWGYSADLMKTFEIYGTNEDLVTGQDPESVTWHIISEEVTWHSQYPNLSVAENLTRGFSISSQYKGNVKYLRYKITDIMNKFTSDNYGRINIGSEHTYYGDF